jgi:hypothetical protein
MTTTTKDATKAIEKAGTKIDKQKLLDAIRRAPDREFHFATDGSGYAIVLVRVP